jgi:predicted nucleotide-binding protein
MSVVAEKLDELLVDLSDLATDRQHHRLSVKLSSLRVEEHEFGYSGPDASKLETRLLRVIRAFETFGSDALARQEVGEEVSTAEPISTRSSIKKDVSQNRKVFVVHGHDEAVLQTVVRLIEKLNLIPIVLREEPNKGATIIEKFEANADVGFAVVLMTADDMGASIDDAQSDGYRPRARQNVIMELGYFAAYLSRSRICVLKSDGVEEPSDILGVVYQAIDSGGGWRLVLGRELKAAGYNVDLNLL